VTGLPALRIKGSVQRRVVAAFTDRLVLKATAIFLAIVLWFVVNAKEPQIELGRRPVHAVAARQLSRAA
jgi:membrane protein required for beta-lactamase induction